MNGRARRDALTLMELVVVLAVLVTLAALVVPLLSNHAAPAAETVTRSNLAQIRDVLLRYRADMEKQLPRPGYSGLNTAPNRPDRPQLRYLFVNPGPAVAPGAAETTAPSFDPLANKGWRGPYMAATGTYTVDPARGFTRDYGETGDPCVADGWGRPVVILESVAAGSVSAELRSAGPDGVLLNADDVVLDLY